jgi:hypothetical protein
MTVLVLLPLDLPPLWTCCNINQALGSGGLLNTQELHVFIYNKVMAASEKGLGRRAQTNGQIWLVT